MKNVLLLAFLASATAVEAAPLALAPTHVSQDQNPSKQEMKRQRKLRKQNGPEVYKGSVANQSRLVNDAPGANKDDDSEDSPRKSSKRAKKQ